MAMRPRGGGAAPGRGARQGGVQPVYEDFRPRAEWQQDDESHILNIYLPGFMKEQIRVTTEGRNTIRVRGERLVAGNKWHRFQEDFQVPENGAMNSVRAKFQGGVLNITVPKVKVDATPPKTEAVDDTQKQRPTPQKVQDKVPPSDSARSQAKDEKDTQSRKPPSDPRTMKQGDREHPTPQKGQDRALPATDQKSSEPKKLSSDHERERDDQEGDQRGRSVAPLPRAVVSHDTAKKDSSESKEKHIASERQDGVRKTKEEKEEETAKKSKFEKDGAKGIPEEKADSKELHGALKKLGVKGIAELNQERQLLVNMGAAMLVIVALTAYVTYNFASAKR